MKKVRLLLASLLFLFLIFPLIPAVVINEVEINPPGVDSGFEWVELYTDSPINISGFFISDSSGNNHSFPDEVVSGFFILDSFSPALANTNQKLTLYNRFNISLYETPFFNDTFNNNLTFSSLPDLTGNFSFQDQTISLPNEPVVIANLTNSDSCVFSTENITLSVYISGFCIESVVFSTIINGTESNISPSNSQNLYSYTIHSNNFSSSQYVNYSVSITDCLNRTFQNSSSFYVNSRTFLTVNPSTPDGLNSWYVSVPEFSLSNPDAPGILYRWDGDTFNYFDPFMLENAPNGNQSAGILDLRYRGSFSCGLEPEQSALFKVDLTNPLISLISPLPNSTIFNNQSPLISIYLDEVYQSNSGINLSSIILKLDSIEVSPLIEDLGIDALLSFQTENISEGTHNISISIADNSGRSSSSDWIFHINITNNLVLDVNSPESGNLSTRRIQFNITTNRDSLIQFTNYDSPRPRPTTLCRSCDEYGFYRKIFKSINEGWNNLSITALDSFNNIKSENVLIFVDSKAPRIHRTEPSRNKYTNGSLFSLRYTEENPVDVTLSINEDLNLSLLNCTSGNNQFCSTPINLSVYDNTIINYSFSVSDGINEVSSRPLQVVVDTTSPVLTVNTPESNETYSRFIVFNISVSEPVLLQYIDSMDKNQRPRTLCNNCQELKRKRLSLKPGSHNITIIATDKAGNSVNEIKTLEII